MYEMYPKTILSELTGRVSRNVIFWLLIALYLEAGRATIWPAFPVSLMVLLVSYGIPGYVHDLVLIPRFLVRRHYATYISLLVLLLALTTAWSYYITRWVNERMPELDHMGEMEDVAMPYHIFPSVMILAMLTFGKLVADAIQNERRVEQLEQERLTSELSSLRAQINPHFLFNALNTIYGMARRQDKHTPDAVIKLSDILRYGIYECEGREPTLARELEVMRQYIEFARLRMHDKEGIVLNEDIKNAEALHIAPMLLTPFVENAIKHGDGGGIAVNMYMRGNRLYFECSNRYEHKASLPQTYMQSGIGIKNVRRRLELLYKDRYELRITDTDGIFLVELNIELQ
ncbi:sensor histidine kinase [Nemorincola caseinilytica]